MLLEDSAGFLPQNLLNNDKLLNRQRMRYNQVMSVRINKGDKVKHWFAGFGIVERIRGCTALCRWADGRTGYAYLKDLKRHD